MARNQSRDDDSSEDTLVQCPYCWALVEFTIDAGGEVQEYVEDCEVCCRPWNVTVRFANDGSPSVTIAAQDE